MTIIAGTVAFNSEQFVSVNVGTKKASDGTLYPALSIRLKDKDLSVASDKPEQITNMYTSILKQLHSRGPGVSAETASELLKYARKETESLLQEIASVNNSLTPQPPTPQTVDE